MSKIRESLKIYSSLSQSKSVFKPIDAPNVMMYVCGITVYDYCHMGHAKSLVSYDVIARYLRAVGYQLKFVRNITDIDDKIIERAKENGEPFTELTERFIAAMDEDCLALNVVKPDQEPRATDYIGQIIGMIEKLIANEYAYVAENGDVNYEVGQFDEYGKLSHKNLEDLQVGSRVEVEQSKRSPLDFVLWKKAKPGEPAWPSPWGDGRPGWHIECSAMSTCCLAETIDIHGGGADLQFPHHENEIAQTEGATGKPFVNYWLHNGFVKINDEKMSKSLNNFFSIRDVLKHYDGEVLRYFIVASHYRSPLNYSEPLLQAAQESVNRLYQALRPVEGLEALESKPWALLDGVKSGVIDSTSDLIAQLSACREQFIAAMDDDFNTPKALAVLHELVSILNRQSAENRDERLLVAQELKQLAALLGLLRYEPESYFQRGFKDEGDVEQIEALIAARNQAREEKDWAKADELRDQLKGMGIALEDKEGVTRWRREDA